MKKALAVLTILTVLALCGAGGAHAGNQADSSVIIILAAGSLGITSTGSITFPSATLTGDDIPVVSTTAPVFTMEDSTGSGAGYNVTFISSDFAAAGGKAIPAVNFTFTSGGTIGGSPVSKRPSQVPQNNAPLNSAVKVLSAAVKKGAGIYTYSPYASDFDLTVPASTMTGSYTATLTATIADRKAHPREGSYTNKLLAGGATEMLKKVGEEAAEVVVAGALEGRERLVYESADLVYHLLVLLASQDLTWTDVEAELARRFK